jgi:hypothetical protein
MKYLAIIKRYGRYLTFDSLEELKAELSRYFTDKEKASGIVDRLTDFDNVPVENGHKEINHQDFTVCYYSPEFMEGDA